MSYLTVLFICGCLETGRDGVGDYTRRLAGELIRQGHQAQIIAWNDKYISETATETQYSDNTALEVLRIASSINRKSRINAAQRFIDQFNPEWLSLQFVPFAFQNKGLPFFLSHELKQIGKGRKWHVMFHELWVGIEHNHLKDFTIQVLQNRIIVSLLKQLNPQCVHTSLPVYKNDLEKLNIKVSPLPIFSNIDVLNSQKTNNISIFNIAFFSQIGDQIEILNFLCDFVQTLVLQQKKCNITIIGGNKEKADRLILKLNQYIPEIDIFNVSGFLSEIEVSKILSEQDLGVSPIPKHALGKSGSVAAFISHGIPIAAPIEMKGQGTVGFFSNELKELVLARSDWNNFAQVKLKASNLKYKISLHSITQSYINDLNKYGHKY